MGVRIIEVTMGGNVSLVVSDPWIVRGGPLCKGFLYVIMRFGPVQGIYTVVSLIIRKAAVNRALGQRTCLHSPGVPANDSPAIDIDWYYCTSGRIGRLYVFPRQYPAWRFETPPSAQVFATIPWYASSADRSTREPCHIFRQHTGYSTRNCVAHTRRKYTKSAVVTHLGIRNVRCRLPMML